MDTSEKYQVVREERQRQIVNRQYIKRTIADDVTINTMIRLKSSIQGLLLILPKKHKEIKENIKKLDKLIDFKKKQIVDYYTK